MVLATRPHLADAAAAAQRACGPDPHCPALTAFALDNTAARTAFGLVVIVAPALIGAFWGAPLVAREFEAGTHRLVWAQSISRTRWLAVKLAVVGTATVAATALLSALVTWWAAPLDHAAAAVYGTFDQRDIVPIGYALFAFAFGVTAGLVIRRTLPAMALTLAGLLTVRIMVTEWIRPLVVAPRVVSMPLDPDTTGYGSGGNILLGIGPSTLQPDDAGHPERLDPVRPHRRRRRRAAHRPGAAGDLPDARPGAATVRPARFRKPSGSRCTTASRGSARTTTRSSPTSPATATGRSNGGSWPCSCWSRRLLCGYAWYRLRAYEPGLQKFEGRVVEVGGDGAGLQPGVAGPAGGPTARPGCRRARSG